MGFPLTRSFKGPSWLLNMHQLWGPLPVSRSRLSARKQIGCYLLNLPLSAVNLLYLAVKRLRLSTQALSQVIKTTRHQSALIIAIMNTSMQRIRQKNQKSDKKKQDLGVGRETCYRSVEKQRKNERINTAYRATSRTDFVNALFIRF